MVMIGRVAKAHGINGEVELQYTDRAYTDLAFDFAFIDVDGILVPFFVEEIRGKSSVADIVKFCDIDTSAGTAVIKDCAVYIERDAIQSSAADDELALAALVGFAIDDTNLGRIGTITGVDTSSINQLIHVRRDEQADTIDIPFHEDLIASVDFDGRSITMTLPEGFLAIYE